jgi:hypothetical protein
VSPTTALLVAVGVTHILAIAWILTRRELARSRRFLAGAFLVTMPVVGLVLSALAVSLVGADSSPAFGEPELVKIDRSVQKSLLRDRAPLLDRLAGTREERLAALAELSKSGSENAITTLRWTIEHGEGDAVIEAALTLEKLVEEGMGAAAAARKGMSSTSATALASSAVKVACLVRQGLIDAALAPRMAAVARDLFQAAELRGGGLDARLAIEWASLELHDMSPDEGLAVLERALPPVDGETEAAFEELANDLRFAARRSTKTG